MENETVVLDRDGDRPLRFTGRLLGKGENGSGGNIPRDWTRGVRVRIYRTEGGAYVVGRHYWTRWEGEKERNEAAFATSPGGLLDELRDYGGELPPAELEAWLDACAADSDLDAIREEVIG